MATQSQSARLSQCFASLWLSSSSLAKKMGTHHTQLGGDRRPKWQLRNTVRRTHEIHRVLAPGLCDRNLRCQSDGDRPSRHLESHVVCIDDKVI